jgi:hypothetical protein
MRIVLPASFLLLVGCGAAPAPATTAPATSSAPPVASAEAPAVVTPAAPPAAAATPAAPPTPGAKGKAISPDKASADDIVAALKAAGWTTSRTDTRTKNEPTVVATKDDNEVIVMISKADHTYKHHATSAPAGGYIFAVQVTGAKGKVDADKSKQLLDALVGK